MNTADVTAENLVLAVTTKIMPFRHNRQIWFNLIIWKTSWKIFGSVSEIVHLTEIIFSLLLCTREIRGSVLAWDRIYLIKFAVYLPQVLQTNAAISWKSSIQDSKLNTSCRVSQPSQTDVVSLLHLDTCINSRGSQIIYGGRRLKKTALLVLSRLVRHTFQGIMVGLQKQWASPSGRAV
jgi:hypothetical protein